MGSYKTFEAHKPTTILKDEMGIHFSVLKEIHCFLLLQGMIKVLWKEFPIVWHLM